MRPFRFVIHLRDFGWQPTVLTIGARGQALTDKEARLLEGIDVVSLEPPLDLSVAAESQLGLTPARRSRPTTKNLHRHPLLNAVDRHFPVDTWLVLFWLKYRQILETVERVQPDVLWSTGDPWSGLVIGEKLSRRFGIPWVADFRDPWTLCEVRTDGPSRLTRAVDRRCERRVLTTADVVLFQAQQTEAKYRAHYADLGLRTTTIYNSYDPVVFDDAVDLEAYAPLAVSSDDALHLGFFGRFRAMSPATLIIDVLAAARRRHGALADRLLVHSFGPLNTDDARYAREQGVLAQFRTEDAVPLEKAVSALQRFDLLLLSTDLRRDEIIPAKLLEYLAAARPILSLSRNPEVARILERTGAGIQEPPEDPNTVADRLVACLQAKDAGRPMPIPFDLKPEEVCRFEARRTTRDLAALFDSLLDEAPAPVPPRRIKAAALAE